METNVDHNTERRNYYRINDIVGLTYKVLGRDDNTQPSFSDSLGLSVTSLFAEIDHEFNQVTNTLWHENPTIAKALGLLNKKLSIVAAHSLQDSGFSIDSYEEMMVNLSGCGIAFECTENLSPGTQLQLTLVLQPSNTQLKLTGKVIACDHKPINVDKPFSVRINFDEHSNHQEQLIQHIVQKQCAQIGSKVPMLSPEE